MVLQSMVYIVIYRIQMCTKVLVPYIHKLENPALFTAQGCEYLLLIVTPTVYPRLVVNYNFSYFSL